MSEEESVSIGIACLSCGFDNPGGMKFCIQCASPLSTHCLQCGFDNPPGAVFCGQCGTALSPRLPERRQLTVLSCDLVDSTHLSQQLDPEALQQIVHAYQDTCVNVIKRFEGHVGQYLGDGLLVYFGYPAAHEDDAQRAVRAGLGIVQEIQVLSSRLRQPMRVRVGLDTGQVVASHMGRNPMSIVGGTPHIATRLQDTAEPNTVRISATTYELVQGYFPCQDLGEQPLRGIATKVQVHQILGEGTVKSRFDVAVRKGLTPQVGRQEEVALLLDRWQQAKTGQGRVVLISGEAGIGKSRLVQAFKERVVGESYIHLSYHCSPYYRHSALYPAIDYVQRLLGFKRDESHQDKLRKLEKLFKRYDLPLPEIVPLFASLLSIPVPEEHYPSLSLTPERQKQQLLEAMLALLLAAAERRPICMLVEDLHWADPSTLEFLGLLITRVLNARFLLLLTSRSEFEPPWGSPPQLTLVELGRLSPAQSEKLVTLIPGGETLETSVVHQLAQRSDGIPLFTEELTRMVVESSPQQNGAIGEVTAEDNTPVVIPRSLQDLLTARLDKLGPAKETAQLGAVLGEEFSYELIKAVSALDELVLQHDLRRLVEAEILNKDGNIPQARYFFHHALIQEAAYQSLLVDKRQQHHDHMARILKEQFPHLVEAQPELLAHHLTEAGSTQEAIGYWQKAGEKAIQRSANNEAIDHITRGLGLIEHLSAIPQRLQQELQLQMTLGVPLMATKGYAAPEVKQAYDRARELCQQVGDTVKLVPVLRGLAAFYYVRAELRTARTLGEQLLKLTQTQRDTALLLEAHQELGGTLSSQGEFTAALHHLEQGILLYDSRHHHSHTVLYGQDPGVSCLSRASHALWFLGYPDQALAKSHDAITLAKDLNHPHSLAYALNFSAILHQLRGEVGQTLEKAEEAIRLSLDHRFPIWASLGTVLKGWAQAYQGLGQEGITLLKRGLESWRAAGAEIAVPQLQALLVDAYRKEGQTETALTVLEEALSLAEMRRDKWGEAELYKLKGELILQQVQSSLPNSDALLQDGMEEAEKSFRKSFNIAQSQKAKSRELQAAIALSRIWQFRNKKESARQILSKVYNWFAEGFDTKDLQEAKNTLEDLL